MQTLARPLLLVTLSLAGLGRVSNYEVPTRLGDSAAACRAHSIRAVINLQGATGFMLGSARLTNVGTAVCLLREHVALRLVDARAKALSVRFEMESKSWLRSWIGPRLNPTAGYTGGQFALRPHQIAWVLLRWRNWCGRASNPLHILIMLPSGGGSLSAQAGAQPIWTPRCDNPKVPSVFQVGPVVQRLRIGGS
jgi:hypothetical protein